MQTYSQGNSTALLTTSATAEVLGVPRQTLAAWRCQGKGPAYAKVGKYVRYRRADVEAWLETQTIHPEGAIK
jgi:excisionase family DNA binding protein